MKYNPYAALILLVSLLTLSVRGQVYERSRQETRSFKVYDQTTLEVYNKYGNIQLLTWEKDSVKIVVDLSVKASKESKAEKIFEYIDFEFSDSRYYIIARTRFRQNQGSFWAELSDLANTVFSGSNKAQVDYTIYLPRNIPVKLENKFGNIYATDHAGPFEVHLSNGDLKAHHLSGEVNLDLGFGHADIQHLEQGKIVASYLELELGTTNDLALESKSGEYRIGKAGLLKIQSRRDKVVIEELASLSGSASFSFLTIHTLHKYLRMETEYGEVDIRDITPSYQQIELKTKFTDLTFVISSRLNTRVSVSHSSTTGIHYPGTLTGLTSIPPEKEGDPGRIEGVIGQKGSVNGNIDVTIQSGNVTFQEQIQMF